MRNTTASSKGVSETRPRLLPPLKWAGGKRWLAPQIAKFYESYRSFRLVEPFVGGMGIALSLMPERALLNDINQHLINFYLQIKKGLKIDFPLENNSDTYYRYRKHFNDLIRQGKADSGEAAALFYYLNRTGFNGLCRFNKKGEFNVPFGRYKKINYQRNFDAYTEALSSWEFRHGDFEALPLAQDDFVYADPPYDVEFTSYSAGGFSWRDQVRLAEWLARHSGPVVASNLATPRILDLYGSLGFEVEVIKAPRRISSNGNRDDALEMLATKDVSFGEMPRKSRNTNTGHVLEVMLAHALERGGYKYTLKGSGASARRTFAEPIPSDKARHQFVLDAVAVCPKTKNRIGISAKWQETSGTAEEKVALETIRLLKLVERGDIDRAYLVMGGNGWTLRNYYLSQDFMEMFSSPAKDRVKPITLEDFVALANQARL